MIQLVLQRGHLLAPLVHTQPDDTRRAGERKEVKAGETGRLFGAVTVAEIAAAISEATGESVDKRTIAVDHAVRTLGSHQVTVRLHEDVLATVAINVVKA